MRHPQKARRLATDFGQVPVLQCGRRFEPASTQTLLDLFTIETQGRLDNLHIAMVGDLKYGRTVHSLTGRWRNLAAAVFLFLSRRARWRCRSTFWICWMKRDGTGLHGSIEEVMADVDILI